MRYIDGCDCLLRTSATPEVTPSPNPAALGKTRPDGLQNFCKFPPTYCVEVKRCLVYREQPESQRVQARTRHHSALRRQPHLATRPRSTCCLRAKGRIDFERLMAILAGRIRVNIAGLCHGRRKCGNQIAWEWMVASPDDSRGRLRFLFHEHRAGPRKERRARPFAVNGRSNKPLFSLVTVIVI